MTGDIQHIASTDFEELYIHLREKEERLYADDVVHQLPQISPMHPHFREWQVRNKSCKQLIQYLTNKRRSLDILEIGCGNGWLSAKLSRIESSSVTGIDINTVEIEQAKRVFKESENLRFENRNILEESFEDEQFDIIIFAASVQYFPSFQKIVKKALLLLRLKGEIHVIDSHFYKNNEVCPARLRSREYYEKIGMPEMMKHYFHHSINELKEFDHKILHSPNFITHLLLKTKNPFYWICIQNL